MEWGIRMTTFPPYVRWLALDAYEVLAESIKVPVPAEFANQSQDALENYMEHRRFESYPAHTVNQSQGAQENYMKPCQCETQEGGFLGLGTKSCGAPTIYRCPNCGKAVCKLGLWTT